MADIAVLVALCCADTVVWSEDTWLETPSEHYCMTTAASRATTHREHS